MKSFWTLGLLLATVPLHARDAAMWSDRSSYIDGEVPRFEISGVPPGTKIYWSSLLDGKTTGEGDASGRFGTYYGHQVGADGTWSADAYAVQANESEGFWTKIARIGDGPNAPILRWNYSVRNNPVQNAPVPTMQNMIGIANWGNRSLVEGARHIRDLGAQSLYVCIGKNYKKDYPKDNFGSVRTITDLAKSQQFQTVFNMPFKTISIAAYPLQDPDFLTRPNLQASYREIYDLAKHFFQSYKGSGKTFILKNWEGDNQLREIMNPPTPALYKAMREWLQIRRQALLDARRDYGRTSDVKVQDAIEFNSFDSMWRDEPCVLRDVIPYVDSDYVSYSAYDSVYRWSKGDIRRRILDDIAFIRQAPGMKGRPLMIGEYGLPLSEPDADERTRIATEAFREAGIPLAYYWQIMDSVNDADKGYGLVGNNGEKRSNWDIFNKLLNGGRGTGNRGGTTQRPVVTYPDRPRGNDNGRGYVLGSRPNHYQPVTQQMLDTMLQDARENPNALFDHSTRIHGGYVVPVDSR